MSSIEQRLADALADIEAMLTDGADVESALNACAVEYDIRPDVLSIRAQKVFGDLSKVGARSKQKAAKIASDHKAETAVDAYLLLQSDQPFGDWFEHRVGRRPTAKENAKFTQKYLEHLVKDMKFEF